MKKFAVSALSTNGVIGKDEGDYVRFPASFASEGIFTDPEGHKGLRSPAEVEKMVPFMNGMRVVLNHPGFTGEGITAATLADKDFPVIGWTENAKFDVKDNTARVIGDICISKVDRAGNDRKPLIAKMNEGTSKNVSIGYFYNHVPATGEFHGVTYDHLEVDVNPYHLAILTPEHPPQAAPPIVGVGCNAIDWSTLADIPVGLNPYPNYHVAIVTPMSAFEPSSVRRKELPKSKGGKGGVIANMAKPKGKSTMEIHSYWFPKDLYTIAEVKAWLKEYGVEKYQKIEPATGKNSHSQGGFDSMDGDEDKEKEKKAPSIAEMNLNALIGQNAEVKGLAEQKAALDAKLKELDTQVKALNAKAEKGDEAVKALEKIKAEERKTKVDRIKAVYDEEELKELFPEDTLDKIGEDELARHLRVVDLLAKEETEEPAAPAPPMARSDKALKVPAGKTAPASGENEDDRFLPNLFQLPTAPGRKALETQED
jgi:hypothetical protein